MTDKRQFFINKFALERELIFILITVVFLGACQNELPDRPQPQYNNNPVVVNDKSIANIDLSNWKVTLPIS